MIDRIPITLVGHFQLVRRLGYGGMGIVYEAIDRVLERHVALKLVRVEPPIREKARARHVREAQALARAVHPNVVQIYEAGFAGDESYIAMELVPGPTLQQWMHQPRDWREIVGVFIGIARGLAHVHALGLVHRDVKPSNVLVDLDGTPRLGDFGLVTSAGATQRGVGPGSRGAVTTDGDVIGTPAYMAPEQRQGQPAHAAADQFAFCASLYEALTGVLPAEARATTSLPRRVRAAVQRGLDEDPAKRWPSMAALARALDGARRGPMERIAAALHHRPITEGDLR